MSLNLLSELMGKEVNYLLKEGVVILNRWKSTYAEIDKQGVDELIRLDVLTIDSGNFEFYEENYVLDVDYILKNKKKIVSEIDMSKMRLLLSQLRDIKLGKILS